MVNNKQYDMSFCRLELKLYETGKKSPSFEYQAPSTKAKFMCTLTQKLYGLSQVMDWYNTPEVQAYAKAGYILKWGSKIQQAKETKYGADTEQMVCLYMVKPFKSGAIDGMKKIQVPPIQPQPQSQPIQTAQPIVKEEEEEFDDEIPF